MDRFSIKNICPLENQWIYTLDMNEEFDVNQMASEENHFILKFKTLKKSDIKKQYHENEYDIKIKSFEVVGKEIIIKVKIHLKELKFEAGKWELYYGNQNFFQKVKGSGEKNLSELKRFDHIVYDRGCKGYIMPLLQHENIALYIAKYSQIKDKAIPITDWSNSEQEVLITFREEDYQLMQRKSCKLIFYNLEKEIQFKIDCLIQEKNLTVDVSELFKLYDGLPLTLDIALEVYDNQDYEYYFLYQHDAKHEVDLYDKYNLYKNEIFMGKYNDDDIFLSPFLSEVEPYLSVMLINSFSLYSKQLEAKVTNIDIKGGKLYLKAKMKDHGFTPISIFISLRSKSNELTYEMDLKTRKKNRKYISIDAMLDLASIRLEQFYWDVKGKMEKGGIQYDMQLKNRNKFLHRIMYFTNPSYTYSNGFFTYPYKTKSKNFALNYRLKNENDSKSFLVKEYIALSLYFLLKPFWKHKKIWLVYEKYCIMAQDNGYYFFDYCMKSLGEKEKKKIFYIIDKSVPDYERIKNYDKHVIQFLSIRHMIYLLAAEILISSDTKAHAYAWHSPNSIFRNLLRRKKNVFLQHGVMAFKSCHQGLRKYSTNGSNLFITSSEFEKQIILDFFQYKKHEVVETGLARWDVIENHIATNPREILLMPTWRNWLEEVDNITFKKSKYFMNYMELLNHPHLEEILEKNNLVLNFYIHPKFKDYIEEFEVSHSKVQLIAFGTKPLNELIMSCSMMITDYSSAAWDVYYLEKPVLFYLFDLPEYMEMQGSYIDMEKETFGDNAKNALELVERLEHYIANDFKEKEKYQNMRDKLLPYRDHNNSKRIYEAIRGSNLIS